MKHISKTDIVIFISTYVITVLATLALVRIVE